MPNLTFDPEPFLQAFRAKQAMTPTGNQIGQQLGQGVNQLGDTFSRLAQQGRQNRMQELQMYDPNLTPEANQARMDYLRTGKMSSPSLPQQSNGMGQSQFDFSSMLPSGNSQSPTMNTPAGSQLMPNIRPPQDMTAQAKPMLQTPPGFGQMASAGVGDTPDKMPQPPQQNIPQANPSTGQPGMGMLGSPLIEAHKQFLAQKGQPQGQPQPSGMSSMFQRPDRSALASVQPGTADYYNASPADRAMIDKGGEFKAREADRQTQMYNTKALRDQSLELQRERLAASNSGKSGKEDSAALKDIQDSFNKDKNVVSSQGTLDKLQQAKGLLEAGNVNNATAKQALQTALTFISTGAQRVNETELKAFGGAKTVTNRASQWIQGIDAGTLTPRDYQDMKQVVGIYANAAHQNYQDAGLRYAKQLGQRTGNDPKDEYKRITGDDYQEAPKPGQTMNVGRFKVTVK